MSERKNVRGDLGYEMSFRRLDPAVVDIGGAIVFVDRIVDSENPRTDVVFYQQCPAQHVKCKVI